MSCSFRVCNFPGKKCAVTWRASYFYFEDETQREEGEKEEKREKNSLVERFQLQQQWLIVDHVGDIATHPVTMLSQGRGIIGGHLVIADVRAVRDTWKKSNILLPLAAS